jgi:hypothetical protein
MKADTSSIPTLSPSRRRASRIHVSIVVYGEKASRTHENQMFQAFLERLEDRWVASDDWIFVVANIMWNGAKIDLVCILASAILVADFKSHSGKPAGRENRPWQADGILVKGGRKDNPYQQLRDNKFSVLDWLKSKSLLSGRNLGHISACVAFSGRFVDQLELPPKGPLLVLPDRPGHLRNPAGRWRADRRSPSLPLGRWHQL